MSILGKRLKTLRKENNLTQSELAKSLGLAFSTISMYERGQREPDFETMEAIADYFNVTMDYLYGKTDIPNEAAISIKASINVSVGEYIKKLRLEAGYSQEQLGNLLGVQRAAVQKWECGKVQNLKRETIKKLAELFNVSPSSFIDSENVQTYDNIIPMPKMNKIPLLGTIACGEPILAEENIDFDVDIPQHINADFALRCRGDSMIDVHINDGDIVYIRQQPTVDNGQIAAVLIGEEATLKKVYLTDGTLTLVACNSAFAPLVYSGAELEDIRILGKAVGYTSKI